MGKEPELEQPESKVYKDILGRFEPTICNMREDLLRNELQHSINLPYDHNMKAMLFNQEESIPKQELDPKPKYEDIIRN